MAWVTFPDPLVSLSTIFRERKNGYKKKKIQKSANSIMRRSTWMRALSIRSLAIFHFSIVSFSVLDMVSWPCVYYSFAIVDIHEGKERKEKCKRTCARSVAFAKTGWTLFDSISNRWRTLHHVNKNDVNILWLTLFAFTPHTKKPCRAPRSAVRGTSCISTKPPRIKLWLCTLHLFIRFQTKKWNCEIYSISNVLVRGAVAQSEIYSTI